MNAGNISSEKVNRLKLCLDLLHPSFSFRHVWNQTLRHPGEAALKHSWTCKIRSKMSPATFSWRPCDDTCIFPSPSIGGCLQSYKYDGHSTYIQLWHYVNIFRIYLLLKYGLLHSAQPCHTLKQNRLFPWKVSNKSMTNFTVTAKQFKNRKILFILVSVVYVENY